MDHPIVIIQKRCRVCGNLFVATGKRKRSFYQCSEFAAQLFSVFSIDISNDVPGTHPSSFCYSCKQVLDRYQQFSSRSPSHIQELHHYLSVDTCMHTWCCTPLDLSSKKKERGMKKADPHHHMYNYISYNAIIACIKAIAPPHYSPLDVPLATINNPVILD